MRKSIAKAREGLDEAEKLVNWMDSADLAERVSVSVAYSDAADCVAPKFCLTVK